ncbi:MAG: M28 family peptidase [Spirochaetales bacterium]|nr:M28 family peptidase [Spirochaetales bacterium]
MAIKRVSGGRAIGTILALAATFAAACACAPSGKGPAGTAAAPDVDGAAVLALAAELAGPDYSGRALGSPGGALAAELLAERLRGAGYSVVFREFPERVPVNAGNAALETVAPDGARRSFAWREDFREIARGGYEGGRAEGPLFVVSDPEAPFPRGSILLVPGRLHDPEDDASYAARGAAGLVGELVGTDPARRPLWAGQAPGALVEPLAGFVKLGISAEAFDLLSASPPGTRALIESPLRFVDVTGRNVVATRDGDGGGPAPRLLICAHYDHVGTDPDGSYFPGALDNASGAAMAVALGEALALALPDADLAILLTDGEEVNLSGASAFARAPDFPIAGISALNLDMLGSRADMELSVYSLGDSAGSKLARSLVAALEAAGFRAAHEAPVLNLDHGPLSRAGAGAASITEYDTADYHTKRDLPSGLSDVELDRLGDALAAWALAEIAGR